MPIIAPIPRTERRLMQKTIHKTRDKNHARRLTAMLKLHRGDRVSDVSRTLCCTRSFVGYWINWFTLSGIEGLKSLPAGRSRCWSFEYICTLLRELIKHSPGYCQFCQPVIDSCIKGVQFVVGQIVFVFSITFSSVSLEVQRLRRNSHSCLVM